MGFSNEDLEPLRSLLKGTDPAACVSVSPEQHQLIDCLAHLISERAVNRRDPSLPIDLTIMYGSSQLLGALAQCKRKKGERKDVRVLEWIFTALQPKTTIQRATENLAEIVRKGRQRILSISGEEPGAIYLPIKRVDLDWYLQNSGDLAISLLSTGRPIVVHSLPSPIIVRACPECSHHGPGLGVSVNPRGLGPLEIWQMDVTHMPEFGRLQCICACYHRYLQ